MFEQILTWAVVPTFDLVVEHQAGVVIARRRIAPYRNVWALPGLRMLKGESIDDCLSRIALQELGIAVDTAGKRLLGQYVGKFTTEHARQDLSTAYAVRSLDEELSPNPAHFSSVRVIERRAELPSASGAMYRAHLDSYFASR